MAVFRNEVGGTSGRFFDADSAQFVSTTDLDAPLRTTTKPTATMSASANGCKLQELCEPMKFISICDRSGIVECEIFAYAYRSYGLATVRYPIVQVTAEVTPFDNQAGFTLAVQRIEKARHIQMTKASS